MAIRNVAALSLGVAAFLASAGVAAQGWVPVPGVSANSLVAADASGTTLLTDAQRSTNGGESWSNRTDTTSGFVSYLYPSLSNPSQVYTVHGTQDDGLAVRFSGDGGATWAETDAKVWLGWKDGFSREMILDLAPVGSQPGRIYAVHYLQGCGFLCTPAQAVEPLRSEDGGKTWVSLAPGLDGHFGALLATPANPNVAYATTDSGVFASDDAGATWKRILAGSGRVVVDAKDAATVYFLPNSGAPLVTSDGGTTWQPMGVPVHGFGDVTVDPYEAGRAYSVDGSRAYQTVDRGMTWQQLALGDDTSMYHFANQPALAVASTGASRTLYRLEYGDGNGTVFRLDVPEHPLVLDTDIWWDPAQSGWGISIVQHEDRNVVAVWYYYDAQGKATWAIVPGGTWNGQTFSGTLYKTTGPAFFSGVPFDPAQVAVRAVGTATLRFADANSADVSFAFTDGSRFDHHVVRQQFARPVPPSSHQAVLDAAGLWWNPAQSGWGIVFYQHQSTAYGTWFVYDAQGQPTWLVTDAFTPYDQTLASVDLFATTGPPFNGPYDPAKVAVTTAGTFYFNPANQLNGNPTTLVPTLGYLLGASAIFLGTAREVTIPIGKEPF